jgi:hypothetical protein
MFQSFVDQVRVSTTNMSFLPPPPLDAIVTREWDLTMQHVIPLIDGARYVKMIALEANVGTDLVG